MFVKQKRTEVLYPRFDFFLKSDWCKWGIQKFGKCAKHLLGNEFFQENDVFCKRKSRENARFEKDKRASEIVHTHSLVLIPQLPLLSPMLWRVVGLLGRFDVPLEGWTFLWRAVGLFRRLFERIVAAELPMWGRSERERERKRKREFHYIQQCTLSHFVRKRQ